MQVHCFLGFILFSTKETIRQKEDISFYMKFYSDSIVTSMR